MHMHHHLQALVYQLEKLRVKVRRKHLELQGKGTTPRVDEVLSPAFWQDLERYAVQIAAMRHTLQITLGSLDGAMQGARFAPLAYRYSARQSVRDRQRNVQSVIDLTEEVARDIYDLYRAAQSPTPGDSLEHANSTLGEFLKLLEKAVGDGTIDPIGDQPGLHGPAAPPLSGMAPLVVLMMAIVVMIRRKARDRRKAAA